MDAMRAVRLLAALSLALVGGLSAPAPAFAAVRDVRLTQDGASPVRLQVARGDTVRFVNSDTFVHRVVDDGGVWDFDTGTLLPGRAFTVAGPLGEPGTLVYRGAGLDRFTGTVVVLGNRSASPRPSPVTPLPPAAADPGTASPSATAAARPPPATGQHRAATTATRPVPRLSSPVRARRLGLPLALATVLVGGVLSLLLRVLLAEPPDRPGGPPTT